MNKAKITPRVLTIDLEQAKPHNLPAAIRRGRNTQP